MPDLGRTLVFLGLLLVVVGAVVLGLNRLNLPLLASGKLANSSQVYSPGA